MAKGKSGGGVRGGGPGGPGYKPNHDRKGFPGAK